MNRARRPPLQHPLAPVFARGVDSLSTALSPGTTRHYHGTVRKFLVYLGVQHPDVNRLDRYAVNLTFWAGCLACARKRPH